MLTYIMDLLRDELGTLSGKKIAILGVAYKGNVGDTRMSPGLGLARQLQVTSADETVAVTDGGDVGADVSIHDPKVSDATLALETFEDAISDADAAVLMTDHDEFKDVDPSDLEDSMENLVLVDTKGIFDVDEWGQSDVALIRI